MRGVEGHGKEWVPLQQKQHEEIEHTLKNDALIPEASPRLLLSRDKSMSAFSAAEK